MHRREIQVYYSSCTSEIVVKGLFVESIEQLNEAISGLLFDGTDAITILQTQATPLKKQKYLYESLSDFCKLLSEEKGYSFYYERLPVAADGSKIHTVIGAGDIIKEDRFTVYYYPIDTDELNYEIENFFRLRYSMNNKGGEYSFFPPFLLL